MIFEGHIHNGVVVLDPAAQLQEGTRVRVEPVEAAEEPAKDSSDITRLRSDMLAMAGIVKDGPPDLARNHDHYLHGTPRR